MESGDEISEAGETYAETWIDRWDSHGSVLLWESDVESFFHDSDVVFSGFHVKAASQEMQDEQFELFTNHR